LTIFSEQLKNTNGMNHEEYKNLYSESLSKEGISPGAVMQILRVALTGAPAGPDLMNLMSIIGSTETCERINLFIKNVNNG
jgi:glutamyl-tRNA synthetase